MKTFQDTQQILALIKHFQSYGVVRPNKMIYNTKYISTNPGLFSALSLVITQIINALSSIRDLGNELDSEDASSAHKSANKFKQILSSKAFNALETNRDDNKIRKKIMQELSKGRMFFFSIKDMKNPAYHNRKNYANIVFYNHHKIYINDDCVRQYMWDKNQLKFDKKFPKNVCGNNEKNNTKSILDQVPSKYKSKILSTDKSSVHKDKAKVNVALRKYGINPNRKFTLKENPKASDDTDMPRLVKINDIKFFYNPKDVSLQHIIHMNVPFLSNDQDSYDVINDKKQHVVYEY